MILRANALQIPLADQAVHCVITSPPYWGLRDYGVNGQLGLEKTPEEYVKNMVQVFQEVWRVLRDDGTLWLNMGDSYAANRTHQVPDSSINGDRSAGISSFVPNGLKPKDLVGIPWRLAFALQADGWYLRSDIIWSKLNPMPESVTDRPTKAHEYIFLLTKSPRYFFDQEAVRERGCDEPGTHRGGSLVLAARGRSGDKMVSAHNHGGCFESLLATGFRNIRTVWTIATQPFPEAHFATFPEKLVEPCLKAGTSEKGVCPKCGGPWVRIIDKKFVPQEDVSLERGVKGAAGQKPMDASNHWDGVPRGSNEIKTIGWKPSCKCYTTGLDSWRANKFDAWPTARPIVLDPFAGAGTVGVVAQKLNRRFVALELKRDYCLMGLKRIRETDVAML